MNNQVQDEKILKLLRIVTATGYIYITELKVISGMQVYEIGRRERVSNNARARETYHFLAIFRIFSSDGDMLMTQFFRPFIIPFRYSFLFQMFSNDVYSSLNIASGILILNYCKRPGEASTIASFDGKNGQIQN